MRRLYNAPLTVLQLQFAVSIQTDNMFKLLVIVASVACVVLASPKAAPGLVGAPLAYAAAPVAYAAPAPAVVTAHSSQVIAQNFNGVLAAPLTAAYALPAAVAHAPAFVY